MKAPRIAIIDSGISESSPVLSRVVEFYSLNRSDGIYQLSNTLPSDEVGHGTAVTNIIYDVNDSAEYIIIKMCASTMDVDEHGLVYILNYIYDNIDIDIINISMGCTYLYDAQAFEAICKKLNNKGVLIISAFDNEGAISYPAAFNSVIGVDICDEFENCQDIYSIKNSIVDIEVPNVFYRTIWNDKKTIIKGSSFACAKITGKISLVLAENDGENLVSKDSFIDVISNKSKNVELCEAFPFPQFKINRAIIFPYNKESSSILKFSDLISFEIVGVFDERLHGNIGQTIEGHVIQPYDSIEWDNDKFDTVILSCTSELSLLTKRDYAAEIMEKAGEHNINIYTLEDLGVISNRIFYPYVSSALTPYGNRLKLNKTTLPVVGVFGTSSKQGKFTLQMELIRRLSGLGYNVGHISTEPSGYLFNSDYVYHFGYHANLNIMSWESIAMINQLICDIQRKKKDILIIGSQSNTIHYDDSCINDFKIDQHVLILGSMPDYFIVCVNPHDEVEYISRTVNYINSIGNGKVCALVVFPVKAIETMTGVRYKSQQMSKEELNGLKDCLKKTFALPVYILGDKGDMQEICDNIIDFFSEN